MQKSLATVWKLPGLWPRRLALIGLLLAGCLEAGQPRRVPASELHVGAATVDITPDQPVALDGQRQVRISKQPATRIYAAVLALESRDGERVLDQAVMVSCDLVAIRAGILAKVRDKLVERVPGFDLRKLFLSATHMHTAPVTTEGKYAWPESGILPPGEYAEWLTSRVADGVAEAWRVRGLGKVAWGQSQAVIAQNRRPDYAGGPAGTVPGGDSEQPDRPRRRAGAGPAHGGSAGRAVAAVEAATLAGPRPWQCVGRRRCAGADGRVAR